MLVFDLEEQKQWGKEADLRIDWDAVEAFHPHCFVSNWTICTTAPIPKGTLLYRGYPFLRYTNTLIDDRRIRCALLSLPKTNLRRLQDELKDLYPREDKVREVTNWSSTHLPPKYKEDIDIHNALVVLRKAHRASHPVEEDVVQQCCLKMEHSGFLHTSQHDSIERQYVYLSGSFFQHACYPNGKYQMIEEDDGEVMLTITAVRNIEANTQCTIMGHANLIESPRLRNILYQRKAGFTCKCDSCLGKIRQSPRHYYAETNPDMFNLDEYCANCGLPEIVTKTKKLLSCKACRTVRYCGTECQLEHWKLYHKQECKKATKKLTNTPKASTTKTVPCGTCGVQICDLDEYFVFYCDGCGKAEHLKCMLQNNNRFGEWLESNSNHTEHDMCGNCAKKS